MTVSDFISKQIPERQKLLTGIHELIIKQDKNAVVTIESMMGKEMIIYKVSGSFKYGLASVKNHMSLHVLPLYVSPDLFSKYKVLFVKAGFQKGCINFKNEEDVPLKILKDLIIDCTKIDLIAIREDQLKARSKKK